MKRTLLSLVMIIMATFTIFADIYVVSSEKAQVHESDDESSEVIGSLRKGMEINVLKVDAGFGRIDFMGVKGFVSINDLKFKKRSDSTDKADSDKNEESLGDKTKDFVSNTSKKVADGVTGFTGKLFGKKKKKEKEPKVPAEESSVPEAEEPYTDNPKTKVTPSRQSGPVKAATDKINDGGKNSRYTTDNYGEDVAEMVAKSADVTEEGAAGIIYIFENHPYVSNTLIRFNGNLLPIPELEIKKKAKDGLNTYKRAVSKIVVKNPGRIIVSRDFTWFEKPYHDELTLDVADGDVFYIETMRGISNKLNILKKDKGAKELEKVQKDTKNWNINPAQYYEE